MRHIEEVLGDDLTVLRRLKSRFPIFHLSNIFLRDIQYGVAALLKEKGVRVGYADTATITQALISRLERARILIPMDGQTWTVMAEEFRTPQVQRPAAKPPAVAVPAATPQIAAT